MTTTLAVPAECAGVVAVMELLLTTVTPVVEVPPTLTAAPERKPVPVMVTAVPPAVVPEAGEILLIVGAGLLVAYVNALVSVSLWPSLLVTTTPVAPDECAGVVAVIEVLLTTVTPVADVPPIFTDAPERKPVPVIVTAVPPEVAPDVGEIAVTLGAGFTKVYPFESVPLWLSVFVTTTLALPEECDGVFAVIEVLLDTVTEVAEDPPTFTVAPERKPVPVMVMDVPPEVVPDVGEIELTVGAGFEADPLKRTNGATEGTPLLFMMNSM